MYRNMYDTDVTTFDPEGRLHQVEYSMEAVKQGSAVIGVKSDKMAVLASLKRNASELASHQQKLFKIDDHLGIGISGLVADGRVLSKYMRSECLNHKWAFESAMQVDRIVTQVSDKAHVYTQKAEKRPYGVGLLVIGHDKTGAHLYETQPCGMHFEYHAQAIGAKSQGAKTYLHKHFDSFPGMAKDELVLHALNALKGTAQSKLTTANCSLAIVGEGQDLIIVEGQDMAQYLARLEQDDDDDDGDDAEDGEERKAEEAMADDA